MKPNAFGLVAIGRLARSKPDGFTLLISNGSTNAITPVLQRYNMKVDYVCAIVPVIRLASVPNIVTASTACADKFGTVGELVAYGRSQLGMLNFGTVGAVIYSHLYAVLLAKRGAFEAVHVSNMGSTPGMIPGEIQ